MKKIFAPIGWVFVGIYFIALVVCHKVKAGFNWVMKKILPKWNG